MASSAAASIDRPGEAGEPARGATVSLLAQVIDTEDFFEEFERARDILYLWRINKQIARICL